MGLSAEMDPVKLGLGAHCDLTGQSMEPITGFIQWNLLIKIYKERIF